MGRRPIKVRRLRLLWQARAVIETHSFHSESFVRRGFTERHAVRRVEAAVARWERRRQRRQWRDSARLGEGTQ